MQIHEITLKPVKEGVLGGIAKGLTNMAFDYGARTTGVNLRPYFAAKDDQGTVTIKDAKGVNHTYSKSGEKWYDKSGKEVDPATSAVLDNEAKKQAAGRTTATSAPAATQAVTPTPTATTAPATTPAAPLTTITATAPVAKTRTGGRVAGQLSQTPDAIRKRAARAVKKTAAPANAGAGAFGQMAQQLAPTRTASSTGGTVTQTPTGLIHTAKPATTTTVAAKKKVPAKKTPAKKIPTTKPTWKGRNKGLSKQERDYQAAILDKQYQQSLAEDYSNLETMLSRALAAQGQRA